MVLSIWVYSTDTENGLLIFGTFACRPPWCQKPISNMLMIISHSYNFIHIDKIVCWLKILEPAIHKTTDCLRWPETISSLLFDLFGWPGFSEAPIVSDAYGQKRACRIKFETYFGDLYLNVSGDWFYNNLCRIRALSHKPSSWHQTTKQQRRVNKSPFIRTRYFCVCVCVVGKLTMSG